ncbi:MAG: ABC transporter ATP-binding protein, partial [Candidatus Rokuibacteriota bacterium]
RLELARALATRARLLLLDEINTGLTALEMTEAIRLIQRVRDRGATILMVEHLVRLIMSVCDRVVVLDFGSKLAEGTPDEIGRNPDVIRAYLGQPRGGGDARG